MVVTSAPRSKLEEYQDVEAGVIATRYGLHPQQLALVGDQLFDARRKWYSERLRRFRHIPIRFSNVFCAILLPGCPLRFDPSIDLPCSTASTPTLTRIATKKHCCFDSSFRPAPLTISLLRVRVHGHSGTLSLPLRTKKHPHKSDRVHSAYL